MKFQDLPSFEVESCFRSFWPNTGSEALRPGCCRSSLSADEFIKFETAMMWCKNNSDKNTVKFRSVDDIPCVQEVVTPVYIVTYYIKWGNYFLDTQYERRGKKYKKTKKHLPASRVSCV